LSVKRIGQRHPLRLVGTLAAGSTAATVLDDATALVPGRTSGEQLDMRKRGYVGSKRVLITLEDLHRRWFLPPSATWLWVDTGHSDRACSWHEVSWQPPASKRGSKYASRCWRNRLRLGQRSADPQSSQHSQPDAASRGIDA